MVDILRLYRDFRVHVAGPGERHYGGDRWVNTPCPFCSGNPGNHLGFCVDSGSPFFGRFVCHRCGGKGLYRTIAALLRIPPEDEGRVWALVQQYGGSAPRGTLARMRRPELPMRDVPLPPGTKPLRQVAGAVRYVLGRWFDPEELEAVWQVQATGPGSLVRLRTGGSVDYSYRLIVPVMHRGKLVTYQGRDWTGKSGRKYLAAPPEVESRPIKSLLYGADLAEDCERPCLMEGVTDVWRYGRGGLACFGVKYRQEQVLELMRRFDRLRVMFDSDPAAKQQARQMVRALEDWGGMDVEWARLPRGKDPADMDRGELHKGSE